ncbi:TVP38/TMEM64 family protein [Algoriphagus mannitolivorans]|uniref:TVP38/TMEM64 family protein n=1 Tax=Algoriphagus mannitolivorans TaxID=226504 RepID=UPI000409384A|nr:VTT domain-containing protein [Algoriphagus mannitolivorans]
MTKKPSIFKILGEYFGTHPLAVVGWIWVASIPFLGSLLLASQYFRLEAIHLDSVWDQVTLTLMISVILGFALLPTTLTSLAVGFFWGWQGFLSLILGYIFANILGYWMGKRLNTDFLPVLFRRNPNLENEIETRMERPGSLIFFVRISPVIPFAISNFIFASLDIPLRKVLLYGVPGMLPRTLIAFATGMIANSFLGAKEAINHPTQLAILVFLLIFSFGGIYWSWKKGKN